VAGGPGLAREEKSRHPIAGRTETRVEATVQAGDGNGFVENGNARSPKEIASFEPLRSGSFESSEPARATGNSLCRTPGMPIDARPSG